MLYLPVDLWQLGLDHPFFFPFFQLVAALAGTQKLNAVWVGLELCALALATYGIYLARSAGSGGPGYFAFTFPRRVWGHHSVRADVLLLVSNSAVLGFGAALRVGGALGVGRAVLAGLNALGPAPALDGLPVIAAQATYFVVLFLVNDFADFLGHWLAHRFPVLWELHKTHHSAEVLAPTTAYREHPLLLAFYALVGTTFIGVLQGVTVWLYPPIRSVPLLLAGNLLAYLILQTNFLIGHYHVPVSFGRLERFVVSPALHRVHHGLERRYFDKNFGMRITLWDRWFGTYYRPTPEEAETMRVGLPHEDWAPTANVLRIYARPFVAWGRKLRERVRPTAVRPSPSA